MGIMPTEVRRTHWLILLMIIVGFGFVTFDFIELTFLTERTDKFFSWTIGSPVTAAVFGSFYFAASMISFATTSGCDSMTTWLAATSTAVALRRLTWSLCSCGGITLSLPMRLACTV